MDPLASAITAERRAQTMIILKRSAIDHLEVVIADAIRAAVPNVKAQNAVVWSGIIPDQIKDRLVSALGAWGSTSHDLSDERLKRGFRAWENWTHHAWEEGPTIIALLPDHMATLYGQEYIRRYLQKEVKLSPHNGVIISFEDHSLKLL